MTRGAGSGYYEVCKDPWNAPAAGVADEFSGPTVPMKIKAAFTLSTNNRGHTGIGFMGANWDTGFSHVPTILDGADVVSGWTASQHIDYASLISIYGNFRPISAGVKVYYIGAEQTTAGLITVGAFPFGSGAPGTTTLPTNVAEWNDLPNTKTIAPAAMTEPLCLATHCYDRPSFRPFADNLADYDFFPLILVGGSSLATSAAVLRVEVTFNIEALPLLTTFQSHQNANVVPYNPNEVTRTHRLLPVGIGSGEEAAVKAHVGRVASSASRSSTARASTLSAKRKRSRSSRYSKMPMMANYRSRPARRRSTRRKRKLYRRR